MSQDKSAIFNISKDQLQQVVENIAGEPVCGFDATVVPQDWQRYGVRGDKLKVNFRYRTKSGKDGQKTVFAKKQTGPFFIDGKLITPSPIEKHHYNFLTEKGAPIPQLYGSLNVNDPDPREILFVEYLPFVVTEQAPFRSFFADPDHLKDFFTSAARFHAVEPFGEYRERLPKPSGHIERQMAWGRESIEYCWQSAGESKFGPYIKRYCTPGKLKKLVRLWETSVEAINRMPSGFVHGDLEPNQTGRRGDGQVVLFDFEDVSIAPRFWDMATILGGPDESKPRCRPREELARFYLDEYERFSGRRVALADFLTEIRFVWVVCAMTWLKDNPGPLEMKLDLLLREAK